MTLKRLAILLAILIFLAGVGIAWLWQYAYTPQGRARVIIAQLRGDNDTSLRGWLLRHHLVRPGFTVSPPSWDDPDSEHHEITVAADEMVKVGREVLPIVIEAMNDPDSKVQWMAVRACGEFRDPIAIRPLTAFVRAPYRCQGFVESWWEDSMVAMGPEACESLMQLLEDKQGIVRLYAVEALGKLKDKRAGDALARHVSDREEEVRFYAADALVEIGDTRGFGSLLHLLEDSQLPRWKVAQALGRLKDKRATDVLIRHLSDGDKDDRACVAHALVEIGDPRAVSALLKALRDQKTKPIYDPESLAGELARNGLDEGRQYLLAALKSPDTTTRRSAAYALHENGIKVTFDVLLPLLADSDAEVRADAVQTVGELHDARTIPALEKILKDPESRVRRLALEALRRFHDPIAIHPISELLNDPAPDVRQAAAVALKELSDNPPPASQPGKP
jgi:HEAT repeat protein